MMKTRKMLALLLALCMVVVLLVGCNNNANNATDDPGTSQEQPSSDVIDTTSTYLRDVIRVSCYSDGGTLDPFARSSWGNNQMLSLIYQRLANIDADGNLYYAVMKSFEEIDDTHYTLTIWDNVHDSVGNPITADDIMWCFEQYIAAGNQGAVNRFDHFEKVDDYTLTWVCNSPFTVGDLEKNLSNVPLLSQKAYEDAGNDMTTKPVGSGPYKLKSYTAGSLVILEADEDFWMNDLEDFEPSKWELQNVKEIEYQIIQDASSRAIALEMGDIDIADSLEAADVTSMTSTDAFSPVLMPQDPPVLFIFNCSDESPFADVNLRKAVCYALDNDGIASALSVPAQAVYGLEPRMWDAPEEWSTGREYYDYDIDTAKEFLAQSSYNNEPLKLMYSSNDANDGAAIMIESQLSSIGINVELYCIEQSVATIEKYEADKWDFRLETVGGGNYLLQTLKTFSAEDAADHLDNNQTVMMVADDQLDKLWQAMKVETNTSTVSAWDKYFTYDMCYAYAICGYSNQTCASSYVNVVLAGTRSLICPNACTFEE